jgi:hypothetical protein
VDFAITDQEFKVIGLVVDDQLIFQSLGLALPRKLVAIESVDVLGPIRGFLLRNEEPDGIMSGKAEDAG